MKINLIITMTVFILIVSCAPNKWDRETIIKQSKSYEVLFLTQNFNIHRSMDTWLIFRIDPSFIGMDELYYLDKNNMSVQVLKSKIDIYGTQLEKIIAEENSISYIDAINMLNHQELFYDIKTCPNIELYFKKIQESFAIPLPKTLDPSPQSKLYSVKTRATRQQHIVYTTSTRSPTYPVIKQLLLLRLELEKCEPISIEE